MTPKRTPESEDPRAVAAAEKCAEEGFYLKDSAAWQESVRDFLKGWHSRDAAGPATREQGNAKVIQKGPCKLCGFYPCLCDSSRARSDGSPQSPREQPEGEVKYFTADGKFELQGSEIKNRQEEFPGHITYVPLSALQSAVSEARAKAFEEAYDNLGEIESRFHNPVAHNCWICKAREKLKTLAKQSRPSQGPEGSAE